MLRKKTYSQKPTEVSRKWYVVDADGLTLGRLSTAVATKLTGKDKPTFTPHTDGGDHVIVLNASKIKVTGNKRHDKVYYRHSGYPGNLKERTMDEQMDLDPTKVIMKSVSGMIPKNKLQPDRMARLRIFADDQHGHSAQKPEQLKVEG